MRNDTIFLGLLRQRPAMTIVVCLLASVFWFLSSGPVQAQDITTGLVGHWKFDEGSGLVAADSSGNGNDGDLINGAVNFDGINDYVDIGNAVRPSLPVTFSVWIRAEQYLVQ